LYYLNIQEFFDLEDIPSSHYQFTGAPEQVIRYMQIKFCYGNLKNSPAVMSVYLDKLY